MSRVCEIILVCEGERDSAFARGFLNETPRCRGRIDPKVNPGGSGHDWVKNQMVEEIANLERYREGRGVIALLDEDGQGVEQRRGEILRRLEQRKLPSVDAAAGRCLLLPTRNIETWLYWLAARELGSKLVINETDNYKTTKPQGSSLRIAYEHCRPAGAYLHSLDHTQLPGDCPGMLYEALWQLRAFLKALR